MFQGQSDFSYVETGRVLEEDSLALQMHKEFSPAEVFQNQVEFSLRLKSVDEVDDERVFHLFQDIPFGLCVCGIFLISAREGNTRGIK